MTIGKRIEERRKELGLSQMDLAKLVGLAHQSVQQWESGETHPRRNRMTKLANALKTTISWLEFGPGNITRHQVSEDMPPKYGPAVPLISWVQAGALCESSEPPHDPDEWMPRIGNHGSNTYALRVVGDSMEPEYHEGEVIYVDPDLAPVHGSDVIVRTPDGRTTFKRYQDTPEGRFLLVMNPTYPTRRINVPEDTAFCGVVIGAFRRTR